MISRRTALATSVAFLTSAFSGKLAGAAVSGGYRRGRRRLPSGCVLSYCEFGEPSGPLVFYFHGTPGSCIEAGLIEEEACQAGVRLIAIDRPGIGSSSYQAQRCILDWPRNVVELADCLGYSDSSFGILGLSGGAPYASACALRIPDRLTHVAIVSGHTPPNSPGVCAGSADNSIAFLGNHPRLGRFGVKLISRRLDRRPDKVVEKVSKEWTASDKKLILCNPRYYNHMVAMLNEATQCGPDGVVTDVRLLGSCWGFELCAIQGVSVSIWQGGCDRIAHPTMGKYFNRQIVGSELTIDPRAGHVTVLKWHAMEILSKFHV
ncbi:alpha/beta hydrolase [Bythopirellula goksoeyrii]|uniref:Alpha/beta hydrolase family protein n=1 Tax=Bythopirellula goksoeyrii TaxID=1400387 RepID=A0A5B9QFI4_9BACT|nr:alpha/beta hydrolase [Bythopirellula goksoeyrii]QEG33013.1 Alpha/beta hydrolase family protein [Bythopirellula goksoeyrii]